MYGTRASLGGASALPWQCALAVLFQVLLLCKAVAQGRPAQHSDPAVLRGGIQKMLLCPSGGPLQNLGSILADAGKEHECISQAHYSSHGVTALPVSRVGKLSFRTALHLTCEQTASKGQSLQSQGHALAVGPGCLLTLPS